MTHRRMGWQKASRWRRTRDVMAREEGQVGGWVQRLFRMMR